MKNQPYHGTAPQLSQGGRGVCSSYFLGHLRSPGAEVGVFMIFCPNTLSYRTLPILFPRAQAKFQTIVNF